MSSILLSEKKKKKKERVPSETKTLPLKQLDGLHVSLFISSTGKKDLCLTGAILVTYLVPKYKHAIVTITEPDCFSFKPRFGLTGRLHDSWSLHPFSLCAH